MTDECEERALLKLGDLLAKEGDVAGAAEQYLLYCEHVEHREIGGSNPSASLSVTAVRRQVLEMLPERRDVRRKLVESYVNLGLLDDARSELRRLASEWESQADSVARDEVLARLVELG